MMIKNIKIRSIIDEAFTFLLIIVLFAACVKQIQKADMVLHNGKIVTVDDNQPEAQALAVKGDVIAAVGSNSEIKPYIGEKTLVIDLNGKLAIPGFIDGHAHFVSYGYSKMKLNLNTAKNWDEIIAIVKNAVEKAQPGNWILGRGWHQEKWDKIPHKNIEGYPTHEMLSKVSPNNPVLLEHASGHAVIVNVKAMETAGITRSTSNPAGGRIIKFPNRKPTGIFLENAEDLIYDAMEKDKGKYSTEQIEEQDRKAVNLSIQECLSNGVTGFQDAASTFERIDLFKKIVNEGKLGIRLWVMINEDNDQLKQRLNNYKIIDMADKRLTVRAIKRFMDGALGSRGAWLLEPYSDLTSSKGLNTISIEEFTETARLAMENGFQLCTHAIGDRANREVLNVYEKIFKENPDKKNLRWRVEHAQHLNILDIPRFAELGVIASMQGIHCTSDGLWAPKRIGDKRAEEGAYVWQKLIKSGAVVSNGTDAPVEDINPIANFYALVTRRLADGTEFYPDQCMSREQALRAYTINCAYAAFEEDLKGSLTVGKLADIAILSQDIMTIAEEDILKTKVLYTIVGGKVMYER